MGSFTQALYLGLHHPPVALRAWDRLTTGVPSTLESPAEYGRVAHALARLTGLEKGVLGRSTLHLFFDLMRLLCRGRVMFFMDAGLYPIGRWAVTSAAVPPTQVALFRHHDAESLREGLVRRDLDRRRPLVVTDGWCPRCGRPAPLDKYVQQVRRFGGRLIVDDTQALGVLGRRDRARMPYGRGGGGLLPWLGVTGPDVTVVASLAKGFGAPLAVLASGPEVVEDFKAQGLTWMHCSPPSMADVRAAEHALALNACVGDVLRERLLQRVRYFRRRLKDLGLRAGGSLFPVQTLSLPSGPDLWRLHRRLWDQGVQTVLLRADRQHPRQLAFVVNARHRFDEIDRAITILAQCVQKGFRGNRRVVPSSASHSVL